MKKRPKLPVKVLMKLVVLHHHLVSMNDSMYSPFCTESLYTHIRMLRTTMYLAPKQTKGRGRGKGRGEKTTRPKSLQSSVFKQPICFPLNFIYPFIYFKTLSSLQLLTMEYAKKKRNCSSYFSNINIFGNLQCA